MIERSCFCGKGISVQLLSCFCGEVISVQLKSCFDRRYFSYVYLSSYFDRISEHSSIHVDKLLTLWVLAKHCICIQLTYNENLLAQWSHLAEQYFPSFLNDALLRGGGVGTSFFFRVRFTSFHLAPIFLPSSFVSLSYFILAVPMRKCMGKHTQVLTYFVHYYFILIRLSYTWLIFLNRISSFLSQGISHGMWLLSGSFCCSYVTSYFVLLSSFWLLCIITTLVIIGVLMPSWSNGTSLLNKLAF